MLEELKHVHYCKKCGGMLIDWEEDVVELHRHQTFFDIDGIIETGDSEFLDTIKSTRDKIVCRMCNSVVSYHVLIEKDVFLQILKHTYRDENQPDEIFKINLKSRKGQKSMVPPTLQEIKEAMVEELI